MNSIEATLIEIQKEPHLQLLQFQIASQKLSVLNIANQESLEIGKSYRLHIQPTDITVVKEQKTIQTTANQLIGIVKAIEPSSLLCSVTIEIENQRVEALVLKEYCDTIELKEGKAIIILININGVTLC